MSDDERYAIPNAEDDLISDKPFSDEEAEGEFKQQKQNSGKVEIPFVRLNPEQTAIGARQGFQNSMKNILKKMTLDCVDLTERLAADSEYFPGREETMGQLAQLALNYQTRLKDVEEQQRQERREATRKAKEKAAGNKISFREISALRYVTSDARMASLLEPETLQKFHQQSDLEITRAKYKKWLKDRERANNPLLQQQLRREAAAQVLLPHSYDLSSRFFSLQF